MTRFEIQVAGHIQTRWARALGAEASRLLPDGRTVLLVSAVDAAATYGLIARLRDAGLELVSITPSPIPSSNGAAAPETDTQHQGDDRPEAPHASR